MYRRAYSSTWIIQCLRIWNITIFFVYIYILNWTNWCTILQDLRNISRNPFSISYSLDLYIKYFGKWFKEAVYKGKCCAISLLQSCEKFGHYDPVYFLTYLDTYHIYIINLNINEWLKWYNLILIFSSLFKTFNKM